MTLHTSPTQLHHCCYLFRFAWLIKVRIIVVLHPVSSCWYNHLCFLFFFFLTLNPTVVPTAEVRILSQKRMDYCCVSHGQFFSPWISTTNRTILLCYRSYKLQQGGSENNVKSHSRWWSSKKWCYPLYLWVW